MGIDRLSEERLLNTIKQFSIPSQHMVDDEKRVLILGRPAMIGTTHASPEALFTAAGATSVDCLDVSNYEGANIVHDMNVPIAPEHQRKYDIVFDNGTMEHCFNPAQFLRNVHQTTRAKGLVIHSNPVNNYVNHGFYQFSPCLYLAFYLQNNYEVLKVSFLGVEKIFSASGSVLKVVFDEEIDVQSLLRLAMTPRLIFKSANHSGVMTTIFFVARKNDASLTCEIPQQPIYSAKFAGLKPVPVITF